MHAEPGGATRDKDALRAAVRAARAALPDAARAVADVARLPHLLALAAGHAAVSCYGSLAPEPETWGFVGELDAAGVGVLLPVLAGRRTPDWAWYAGPAALRPGWHGIPEPTTPPLGPDALGAVSLVVTSALAATASGERLGTGGGWYDRALTHRSPDAVVAALVNEREVVGHLPTEPWDVRVAALVTEAGVRWA